jgi:hypothetical protein
MFVHPHIPVQIGQAKSFAPSHVVDRPSEKWPFSDEEWLYRLDCEDGVGYLNAESQAAAVDIFERKFFSDYTDRALSLICNAIHDGCKEQARDLISGWQKYMPDDVDRNLWQHNILSDYQNWRSVWMGYNTVILRHLATGYLFRCEIIDGDHNGVTVEQVEPIPSKSTDVLETQEFKFVSLQHIVHQICVVKMICGRI